MGGTEPSRDVENGPTRSAGRPGNRWGLPAAGLAVLLAVLLAWNWPEPIDALIDQARVALAGNDPETAATIIDGVLDRQPGSVQALVLAGRIAAARRRFEEAVGFYDRVPDDDSDQARLARCGAGRILLDDLKQMSAAEKRFRQAALRHPGDRIANERLSFLLGVASRNWESIPFRIATIASPPTSREQSSLYRLNLILLALGDDTLDDESLLETFRTAVPDDPAPLIALARLAVANREPSRARQLLQTAVDSDPGLIEAWVRLGQLFDDSSADDDFLNWNGRLPPAVDRHPGTWVIRGAFAAEQQSHRVAARCYWEALLRDPNHQAANYQLGRMLIRLERVEQATPFLERARSLQRYINLVKASGTAEQLREAAEMAESLGLIWEAYGWASLAGDHGSQRDWSGRARARLKSRLSDLSNTRSSSAVGPAAELSLSGYPLPRWKPGDRTRQRSPLARLAASRVVFRNVATSAGLKFRYVNGGDPVKDGIRAIRETTGGGVAALDYDVDGWPDLLLAQGSTWPPPRNRPGRKDLDRLYRNPGDGRLEDVTLQAGLVEDRYSQGVAVGDFNNDGFPDLYIGNINANRLYMNNGDGTFSDVTQQSGTGGRHWTTSCLVADLNGDTLPDLYAVNYLGGDAMTRVCRGSSGGRPCTPHDFPAAQDQVYVNLGDGRFRNVTDEWGLNAAGGNGLGIVAADFDGSGHLSLFIANDQAPNFFYVNRASRRGTGPAFSEQALRRGLALNGEGLTEACMGIAVTDVDADGLLDLFVTNFFGESNTLYRQQPGLLFIDGTGSARLRDPGLRLLGFGTQPLDGELDGAPDLIVTNGHIENFQGRFENYRMRPQYFRNSGDGRFVEPPAESLGRYFQGRFLGRGMARLDWNRDGLEEVAISHLDAPAALLQNVTESAGHFLVVRLRGIQSDRDAIGTTVTLKTAERSTSLQLTAGDGYLSSNQRQLTFGLGSRQQVEQLEVRWPSGLIQRFQDPPVDVELLLVEGRSRAVPLPRNP